MCPLPFFGIQILAKRDLYVTQNSIPAYIFQNLAAAKVKILPKIEAFSTAECTPLWKLRGLQEITPRNPRILRLGLTGGSDQLRIFSCCSWHCPGWLYHWPWICTFIIIRPQNLFFCCEKSVGANRLKFKFPAIKSAARIKEGGGGGMFRQITKCFFWQVYLSHFCYSRTNFFCDSFLTNLNYTNWKKFCLVEINTNDNLIEHFASCYYFNNPLLIQMHVL